MSEHNTLYLDWNWNSPKKICVDFYYCFLSSSKGTPYVLRNWKFGDRNRLELSLSVNFDLSFFAVWSNVSFLWTQGKSQRKKAAVKKTYIFIGKKKANSSKWHLPFIKLPFLSLQHAVLNVFLFHLQCIQMYLPAKAFVSLCVLKVFKVQKQSSYEKSNIANSNP